MSYSEFTEKDYEVIARDWNVLYASAQRRCADERELEVVKALKNFMNTVGSVMNISEGP